MVIMQGARALAQPAISPCVSEFASICPIETRPGGACSVFNQLGCALRPVLLARAMPSAPAPLNIAIEKALCSLKTQ